MNMKESKSGQSLDEQRTTTMVMGGVCASWAGFARVSWSAFRVLPGRPLEPFCRSKSRELSKYLP